MSGSNESQVTALSIGDNTIGVVAFSKMTISRW